MDDDKLSLSCSNVSLIDVLLERFYSWGATTLFIIPGSHIDDMLIKASQDKRFQIVIAAHEQGAGYMADGFARVSGGPGIVITINGPGANNLTTAAVTAKVDGSPVLFLTGDAPMLTRNFGAFQSSDFMGSNSNAILREALAHSFDILNLTSLSNAFHFFEKSLRNELQSPIHINLPSDIAIMPVTEQSYEKVVVPKEEQETQIKPVELHEIPNTPGSRAAILVGEEVKDLLQLEEIASFSKKHSIPVASTLAAKNIQPLLPEELFLGVFGYAGGPKAFNAILDPRLETIVVFGATLDERNTAAWHPDFFPSARHIIRFSTDEKSSRNYPRPITEMLIGSTEGIYWLECQWSNESVAYQNEFENRGYWIKELQKIERIPTKAENSSSSSLGLCMSDVVSELSEILPDDVLFFLDSGDHRIYGATYWDVKVVNSFFTAAKTGPMGWAICAAIGASFVNKNKQIFVLTGDGCMMMHGMEISIAAKYKCKVVFIVSNNMSYGRIAGRMKNEEETVKDILSSLPPVSWSGFASSLGVPSRKVSAIEELQGAIQEAQSMTGPYLIELITNQKQEIPYTHAIFSSSAKIPKNLERNIKENK